MNKKIDIVIPLNNESPMNDLELRMALRSIETYGVNTGEVYIVTDDLPAWLCNVHHLAVGDKHRRNKDANLIDKLLAACQVEELSQRFIFWSDDQLALRKFDAAILMPVYNPRGPAAFRRHCRWYDRMLNTFNYLHSRGRKLDWNWDSHLPQLLDKKRFYELISPIDYGRLPGYCVNTLYFGLINVLPLIEQNLIKASWETSEKMGKLPEDKLFLGYNDEAMKSDLPQLLQERFPDRSRYERY